MNPMVRGNIEFLNQAQRLVNELSDAIYRNNDLPPFNSGVGKHIRHVLDFYAAFFSRRDNRINYDERGRDPAVETDRMAAVERIEHTCAALSRMEEFDAVVWSKNDEALITSRDQGYRQSTIGRELQFLISHTVHHFAVIAILLHSQGFKAPQGFGVAVSTLAHWRMAEKASSS